MIYYVVTRAHAYTINDFLRNWAPSLRQQLSVAPIDALVRYRRFGPGAYLFSDLDRYSPAETHWANDAAAQIRDDPACRLLNHPGEALGRLQLLRSLHAIGANTFTAYPYPLPLGAEVRLPALVRRASGHDGPVGELVGSHEALAAAGASLRETAGDDVIAVEFSDTVCPDGLYRKYSCFRVGEAIIPRHLLFSRGWVTKTPDELNAALAEEEYCYVATNPHADQVRALFEHARIDYGRIDYALRADGKGLETWEINTNPYVAKHPSQIPPSRMESHKLALRALRGALLALDVAAPPVD